MTTNLPDDAVKAAARAVQDTLKQPVDPQGVAISYVFARAALTAALPHLAPTVDRDTIARAIFLARNGGGEWFSELGDDADFGNALGDADAVLAVLDGGVRP